MNPNFSRRDFLKASAAGLLGLFLTELHIERTFASPIPRQGRILISGLGLYDAPSSNAKMLKSFGRDEVIDIVGEATGNDPKAYNPTWYRTSKAGYVYSGWVQPVDTIYNKPVFDIPASGILGEVTVPYSESRLSASAFDKRGYRAYYGTTYWVTGTVINNYEKSIWYQIYDEYLRESLYLPAQDLHLLPAEELAPLSPDVPDELKHIYVDIPLQTVTVFEDERPVLVSRTATGRKGTTTPTGKFRTFHKGSTVHMAANNLAAGGYDLPGVPWVSFFTGTGVSFHGTYWHNDYGKPRSAGCVNLPIQVAKFIFRWTRPIVPPDIRYIYRPGEGTRVEVVLSTL